MSSFSNTASRPDSANTGILAGLAGELRRWWTGYTSWRLQETAIAHLKSMSDHELRDIGISRSQIEWGVRGERERDRALSRHF